MVDSKVSKSRKRCLAFTALLVAVNAALYTSVLLDRAYIRKTAYEVAGAARSDESVVEAFLEHIRRLPMISPEQLDELPWLVRVNFRQNRLRAGPRTTLEYGIYHAACQVSSRALAALLDAEGIEWRDVTMHDENLHGRHGLIEVNLDIGYGVVDPLYALIYRHPDGRLASLTDLRRDPSIHLANASKAWHFGWGRDGRAERVAYPLDKYDFGHAYRFSYHWFGPARWLVHDGLVRLFGPDGPLLLRRPRWQVFPALTLLVLVDALAGILLGFLLLRAWRLRRRARLVSGPIAE